MSKEATAGGSNRIRRTDSVAALSTQQASGAAAGDAKRQDSDEIYKRG
jgi:hypothetical protein